MLKENISYTINSFKKAITLNHKVKMKSSPKNYFLLFSFDEKQVPKNEILLSENLIELVVIFRFSYYLSSMSNQILLSSKYKKLLI